MNHVTHFSNSAPTIIVSSEISKSCCIREYQCTLHFIRKPLFVLTFFEPSKKFLTKIVPIMMISTKLATPGLLKMKIF